MIRMQLGFCVQLFGLVMLEYVVIATSLGEYTEIEVVDQQLWCASHF